MIAERPVTETTPATAAPHDGESVVRKGKEIYEQVRAQFDTPENQKKCLIIEVDTGECEMVEDSQLARRLYERGPSTGRFIMRIGQPAFFRYRNRPRKVVAR